MDLVIDANILFAALIKEGATSDLLFAENLHLYAPEFLFAEFSKYEEEMLKKTHRSDEEFKKLLEILERKITIMPMGELKPFIKNAEKISPDEKDAPYIAAALKINGAIWSNDSRLKRQDKIKVYATSELLDLLAPKS